VYVSAALVVGRLAVSAEFADDAWVAGWIACVRAVQRAVLVGVREIPVYVDGLAGVHLVEVVAYRVVDGPAMK